MRMIQEKKILCLLKMDKVFDKLYESQKSRMFFALKKSDPSSVIKFKEVLITLSMEK